MASTDISRRQLLAARLRSAVATAAVVGAVGGWVAFGMQSNTAASTTAPAAQVAGSAAAPGSAQGQAQQQPANLGGFNGSGSTTAPSQSTKPTRGRRAPATSTHSSK
jgi:hypothetical protein